MNPHKPNDYIPSSPYFFRIIGIASAIYLILLVILALIFPAPLQEPVEPFNVPNPSKSAWFLLWMQEIVSYHVYFVYLILLFFVGFTLLPFFMKKTDTAKWFRRKYIGINVLTVAVFLFIVTLTVIAVWFRGAYWEFTLWTK